RIQHFERLPQDQETRKKFAMLFDAFNECLDAARIQGFSWEQDTYMTRTSPNEPEVEIKVLFTEEMYNAWMLRYQELAEGGGGGGGPNNAGYEINYTLVQKGVGRIDYDYLNNNFKRYVRSQEEGDTEEQERIKNDLHRFFSTLTAEQQRYAGMVINDLENGDLVVKVDEEFMDYVTEYQVRSEDKQVIELINAFGLDESLLKEMMGLNITTGNLNEFGRFDKLI